MYTSRASGGAHAVVMIGQFAIEAVVSKNFRSRSNTDAIFLHIYLRWIDRTSGGTSG